MGLEIDLRQDPASFARFTREIKAFSPELAKATRKRLRTAGQGGVKAAQAYYLAATSHSNTGFRKGIAAGIRLRIRTSAARSGISIEVTGDKLPAAKRSVERAYIRKPTFRHFVYGHRDRVVEQKGRPSFGKIEQERQPIMLRAMEDALRDAARTIEAGTVT